MSLFSRLFGRKQQVTGQSATFQNPALRDTGDIGTGSSGLTREDLAYALSGVEPGIAQAMGPVVAELQAIRGRLDVLEIAGHKTAPSSSPQTTHIAESMSGNRETIEHAIENALAHFYLLLRGRERFTVPAAMLGRTPDGNTYLPFDPKLQHFLVVMHPLYPHLYTTLIVLPGTFTHVDRLSALPNGVRVHSLHINERKAAPGFMDALRILHNENKDNLFLAKATTPQIEGDSHQLEYFRCTGSDIRNADPTQFPDEQMMFFSDVPEPLVIRQKLNGAEDVFTALETLMREAQGGLSEKVEEASARQNASQGPS